MEIGDADINPTDLEASLGAAIEEYISMADEETTKVDEDSGKTDCGLPDALLPSVIVTTVGTPTGTPGGSPARNTRRNRPSAMEILQAATTDVKNDTTASTTNDTDDKEAESFSDKLDFRVATPNLSRLIDENGSDSDTPETSVMLSHTLGPRSNTNSPFVADTAGDTIMDSTTDLGLGPLEQNPLLTALDAAKGDEMVPGADGESMAENGARDAIDTVPQFVPSSPQKARRGGRRGRRGKSRGVMKVKMFSTRQRPLPSGSEILDQPLEGVTGNGDTADDEIPLGTFARAVSAAKPGRGRGGRRSRGRCRTTWTHKKKTVRAQHDDEKNDADEPVYEGVSVSAPGSPTLSPPLGGSIPCFTPPPDEHLTSYTPPPPGGHDDSSRMSVMSDDSGRMVDVERRIEEIQSLVSSMQKQISATVVPSQTDSIIKSSDELSPDKSSVSSKKDLKMRIKLGDGRRKKGVKRQRKESYRNDDEYQPGPKRKVDVKTPTRHSGRKSEHDLFLDRMKYLASYSDDSRSPSPDRSPYYDPQPSTSGYIPERDTSFTLSLSSKILLSQCKTFNIHLFDFVKCFNIKDLNQLDDLNFNKDIRRQIRALEKGHQIARMKSKVLQFNANSELLKLQEENRGSENLSTLADPQFPIMFNGTGHGILPALESSTLSDQLDNIFDDLLGHKSHKRRGRKKRHRSGHSSKSDPGATPVEANGATSSGAAAVDTAQSSVSDGQKKQFRCKECTFITADLPCIQEHIHMHQEPFHCSECKTIFSQYSVALEHTITKHATTPARVIKSPNFNPNDHFDEVIVDGHGKVLEEHPRNVNDTLPRRPSEDREMNYQCQLCSYRTDDRQEIEKHLQSNHRAEYQYICRICDLAFCKKRETMLKHFRKWHAGLPLDFTTAPGIEESGDGADAERGSAQSSPTRPPSVISIASEGSPKDQSEKRIITSGTDNDVVVEMEETPQAAPTADKNTETPSVLSVENRPCTYKCLQCGAKTDAFDVICAHLEVSHPNTEYSFACPFCDDYKAKTCSFVAEHIRTAHSEHSKRCMERKLENANLYVSREFSDKRPEDQAPPRTDSTRSSNQENRSPDDEVMIVDVASQQARRPLQPISLVHHQTPVQTQTEMVQVFPGFSVSKSEYESYQVFNIKPPVFNHVSPAAPRQPPQRSVVPQAPRPAQPQTMRSMPPLGQPGRAPHGLPAQRPPPVCRPMTQQPVRTFLRQSAPTGRLLRPIQPRPVANALPQNPFPQFYHVQPQQQRQQQPTSSSMLVSPGNNSVQFPVLMQEIMHPGSTMPQQIYTGPVSNTSQ